jgi:Ca2+-binding EF-hand superfamily protein
MSISADSLAVTDKERESRICKDGASELHNITLTLCVHAALDTQEENYRAYKLFSMMDVDSGGSISLRELYRVLMGDAIR